MHRWIQKILFFTFLIFSGISSAENLVIYSCQNADVVKKIIESFKKKNPTVKVEIFQFSPLEMKKTLDKEFSVGSSPIADMLLTTDILLLEEYKIYQRLTNFSDLDTKALYSEITDHENFYFPTKLMTLALFCHTSSEKVKSWTDLTQDTLKDKVTLALPVDSPTLALQYFLLYKNPDLGKTFFQQLKANKCAFLTTLNSGLDSVLLEKALYGIHYDHVIVRSILKDKSLLKIIYPQEGVLPLTEPMAVFKGTKNEKTARALVEFILSVEGQKIITANGYLSARKDVLAPLGFPSTRSLKFLNFDKEIFINIFKNFPPELKDIFGISQLTSETPLTQN